MVVRLAWDVFWDPWRFLDIRDASGRIDHGKVMALVAFVALYALAWGYLLIQRDLDWTIWSLLAALPFGLIGLRIALRARERRQEGGDG